MAEANGKIYDENFYRSIKDSSYLSALNIAPIVIDLIHPKTMVDIGCGVGTWTRAFRDLGVDAYGVDGDYVDKSQLMIDEKFFLPWNLENRFDLTQKFDLAITIEVAEHLTPARAETFVEDLTKSSDVILFSAAISGQGGTNHINEQFQDYWKKIFEKYGFVAIDYLRPKIWNNDRIGVYHRQNIFFYVRLSELFKYPRLMKYYLDHQEDQIMNIVHPVLFIMRTQQFNNAILRVKELEAEIARLKYTPR